MNIYFRKILQAVGIIPSRPEPMRFPSYEEGFWVKRPEQKGKRVVYPITTYEFIKGYYSTKSKAQAACDELNIPIIKRNKKLKARRTKQIIICRKAIAEWDAKYGDKKL